MYALFQELKSGSSSVQQRANILAHEDEDKKETEDDTYNEFN
jgi:hypothetical protein